MRREAEGKAKKGGQQLMAKWAAGITLLSAAGGLLLALLGYGMTLAAEAELGIPHAALFDSAFELIVLGNVAATQFVSGSARALGTLEFYVELYRNSWQAILFMVAACFAIYLVWAWDVPSTVRVERASVTPKSAKGRRRLWHFFVGPVLIALIPLTLVLIVLLIAGALSLMELVPLIGLEAGKAYLKEWVLEPERCLWHINREERLKSLANRQRGTNKTKVALCVAVMKDDETVASGRVAFMTSKAVVLFDPKTGAAQKVPIADAMVRVIPKLAGEDAPPAQIPLPIAVE
jgi:hypothetical protein